MTAQAHGAFERLPCGWLSIDGQGTVVQVNAALCKMFGVNAQTLQGAPFDSLLTRPARVLYQSFLQPLLHLHGHVEEFALAFDLGAGRTLDTLVYSTRGSPDAAADGPAGVIELVVASVSKRRSIEDEMLRVKRAADHAPGMIFQLMQLADGSCRFPYASEAIRRMYGVSAQQASDSAERLLGLLSTQTRAALASGLRDAARGERDWHAVFEVNLPGGPPRWHEAHATARRLANGVTLWHGHCADVTEQRAVEAAVADRLAIEKLHLARSEFLARVSHELRTPLNGILGFAQLLASDKAENLSTEQRDRLGVLTASGRHLLALVNEVLEVTSIEAGQMQVAMPSIALRPLLELALQNAAEQAKAAQVTLLPLVCSGSVWVQADEQRLQQVLANLLSNAIKYNHRAGSVELAAHSQQSGVLLTVQDTGIGIGISAEQSAALFQPFNRFGAENPAIAGHGLGLVITKHLLGLMGCSLAVNSEPGQGSQFSFLMPVAEGHAAAQAAGGLAAHPQAEVTASTGSTAPQARVAAQVAAQAAAQACGHVLYVEDDEVNAVLMAAVLGMRPQLTLHVAATGAQALAAARARRPDLLLLDMHLPDTNGIDVLAALRTIDGLAAVPAIMVSAGASQQDIARALASGFASYWTKPLDVDRTLAELDIRLALQLAASVP